MAIPISSKIRDKSRKSRKSRLSRLIPISYLNFGVSRDFSPIQPDFVSEFRGKSRSRPISTWPDLSRFGSIFSRQLGLLDLERLDVSSQFFNLDLDLESRSRCPSRFISPMPDSWAFLKECHFSKNKKWVHPILVL